MEIVQIKKSLRDVIERGDLARAAEIAGYKTRHGLYRWLALEKEWPMVDGKNIDAVLSAVEERREKIRKAAKKVRQVAESV